MKRFVLCGAVLSAMLLGGCAGTMTQNVIGATDAMTHETSIKAFEKVTIGMTLEDLEQLDMGPSSPGVSTVGSAATFIKNMWQFNEKGESITPLPARLKEQCIDAVQKESKQECYVLVVKRTLTSEKLSSSQVRRIIGEKEWSGTAQEFEVAIFISPDFGVVYKKPINIKGNNPTKRKEKDPWKPLDGVLPLGGAAAIGAVSGF